MVRLVLLIAFLSVAPATTLAQGINLSWDDCSIGAVRQDKSMPCDSDAGAPYDLIVSLQTVTPIEDVIGAEGTIVITMDGPVVPDFWRLDAGGCRQGALSADPNVGITSAPYSCPPAWAGGAVGSATFYYLPYTQCSPNQAVLRWYVGAASPVTLDPNDTEVYLTKLSLARGGTTSCGGCPIPACLVATEVRLLRPSGDLVVTMPAMSQLVTTQGGASLGCPGFGHQLPSCPVPVRASTWGQIKSMYR